MASGYDRWSQQQLIARIHELEKEIANKEKISTTDISKPNPATFTSFPIPSPAEDTTSIAFREPPKQPPKAFDPSKYSTRLIALKFAYLGQKYNGFEHHRNNSTPLPTVEEELWKALVKTRLIHPIPTTDSETNHNKPNKKNSVTWDRQGVDVNWDGCEYSKCGRTDRGVSAFGQVIGVRVRSNKPLPRPKPSFAEQQGEQILQEGEASQLALEDQLNPEPEPEPEPKPFDGIQDELPYIQLLNRVLPPDIRIYAWCPNPPPDFNARFSCKERRYKYFFTNPCFAPVPSPSGLYKTLASGNTMREGWLNIDAMREACKRLEGLHDFRNLCKIDPSKQITNFKRRIFHASIDEVSPLALPTFVSHPAIHNPNPDVSSDPATQPKLYSFTLHGSAFLWHQVRSIVSILFLIGQGLERASLITDLTDIAKNPTRPKYEMASDAPLVLWDCIFPHAHEVEDSEVRERGYEDRLEWVFVGDDGGVEVKGKSGGGGVGRSKWGRGGVIDDVWEVWRGNKIDETLSSLLLDTIATQGQATLDREEVVGPGQETVTATTRTPRVFDGGNVGKAKGKYVPVLKRERQETIEVVNERYARKKGLDLSKSIGRDGDGDE